MLFVMQSAAALLTTEVSAVVTSCIHLTSNFDPASLPQMIEDAPQLLEYADKLIDRIAITLHVRLYDMPSYVRILFVSC